MRKSNPWLKEVRETVTPTKVFLADYAVGVRTEQFKEFTRLLKPDRKTKILDIGVSSDDTFVNSNMFEKLYPHLEKVTLATIEKADKIRKLFPKSKVVKISPGKELPFKDESFDIVTAWATLEHVGGFDEQKFFLKELKRVGGDIFLTTPYRGCVYEPHSGFFFLHWLPLKYFRIICKLTGKKFWSKESNLNPLWIKDVKNIWPKGKFKVKVYKMFGFLPSHLIIYSKEHYEK